MKIFRYSSIVFMALCSACLLGKEQAETVEQRAVYEAIMHRNKAEIQRLLTAHDDSHQSYINKTITTKVLDWLAQHSELSMGMLGALTYWATRYYYRNQLLPVAFVVPTAPAVQLLRFARPDELDLFYTTQAETQSALGG